MLSVLCTILFAILNGASVYLSIPLLDTLFNTSLVSSAAPAGAGSGAEASGSILPGFILSIKDSLSNAFNSFVFSGDKTDALFKICVIIFLAFIFKNISGYFQAYFLSFVEQGIVRDLRDDAYRQLHKLPISYFKGERVGNLISIIVNDVTAVQNSVSATFLNLIREPLSIIVFLGIAISISWQLTVISLITLPFSAGIISFVGIKLRKYSARIQEKIADITSVIQETVSGVKIVKAFATENYENNRFNEETQSYFKMVLRITRIRNLSSPITEILSVMVGVVIIYYGGTLVLDNNQIKASEFLGFLFAIFQLLPPIKELSGVNNRIQESSAAGDRIFEIIDTQPDIVDKEDALSVGSFEGEISFENVTFAYPDEPDVKVLSDLTFSIKKGEVVALVGPSGSGKSTLVDLIPRFYDVTSGGIKFDGKDLRDLKVEDLRRFIGIVTQETILFNDTIRNNICYGSKGFTEEMIIEAAKIANAHSFIMETPNGYDTHIGERGVKLSGGQRQRIAIARALLKNPDIMIFDEATSALDNESEKLVQEALDRLMKSRTVVVIAHRLSTIKNADKILVLDEGVIVQSGTHDQLLEEGGLYKKLYDMQFRDKAE
ncbi:MAG: Lipid A export ATP-binding/permease protein MsbA [Ignavibacteriaceae bacterium]|nr:Lipid A export ATP-binding/permease protein MsbA [Ignavibacteriaceae bacterium]